ncbi:GNAT family N-acetyltransferase [bacterium]|nr:GNAT family N-acetyltransferase [bacterium]
MNNMCILEEYRKCGVGTKLFNEFKNVCKENNIEEIKVTASYGNTNAIKFYRKV